MAIDFRDYLDLERMLTGRLMSGWSTVAADAYAAVADALKVNDWGLAADEAHKLDISVIGDGNTGFASMIFAGCIDHGASVAANGKSTRKSTDFPVELKHVVQQFQSAMEYGATMQLQKKLLQLIAQTKAQHEEGVVQKADPVRDFVSFRQDGDRLLKMISALHTNRLSSWGFVAEADSLKQTTYKLSAMLDKRTSRFCRFIDGQTFTIESARPILESALHTDDPEDLRTIQPWPDQSKDSMDKIMGLSKSDLVARGFHVPPFHPGCRTMMVRVSQKFRSPPTKARAAALPEYLSTADDFKSLGIQIKEGDLNVWNDYVKINPAASLSVLLQQTMKGVIDAKLKRAITVTGKGNIIWRTPDLQVAYDPVQGNMAIGKLAKGELEKLAEGVKSLAQSVGASEITARVTGGDGLEYLTMGYRPTAVDWFDIKTVVADKTLGLLDSVADTALTKVLESPNPESMLGLYALAADNQVLRRVVSALKFTVTLPLSTTGLE